MQGEKKKLDKGKRDKNLPKYIQTTKNMMAEKKEQEKKQTGEFTTFEF